MEFDWYDIFSTLAAGISIGAIIGSWLSKQERRLEYERGKLDGINCILPHYVEAVWGKILRRGIQHGANKEAGGDGGAG